MYPASGYNTSYTYEDLPDEILIRPVVDGEFSEGVIATKQGEFADYLYISSPYNPTGGGLQIYEFRYVVRSEGPRWIGRSRFDFQSLPVGVNDGSAGISECLIDDSFADGVFVGAFKQDTFADTYKITLDSPALVSPEISIVERASLCQWFQEGGEYALIYVSNENSEFYTKWVVQLGGEGAAIKQRQNTPEGSNYTIPVGNIHEGGTLTVEPL
jgi:hypothetical protein